VNQLNTGTNRGAAYGSFNPAAATNTIVAPLVMDRNFGYFTGVNVYNISQSSSTNVNCTYTNSSVTFSQNGLAPNTAVVVSQLNQIANGYTGGMTCIASGGSENKIVAVVNELRLAGAGDQLLVYEAANK
jgi:hypothetical protein